MSNANDFYIQDGVLVKYEGRDSHVEIPDGVTTIGHKAFFRRFFLESVVIPDSVTRIAACAFAECSNLVSVNIPEGVTTIGNEAFSFCTALKEVIIPDSVTAMGRDVFWDCDNLERAVIPEGVTALSPSLFAGCGNLREVTLPRGITVIPVCCFIGCSSLAAINIPEGVTEIQDCAFNYCESLRAIVLPPHLESIGANAFAYCERLKELHLPASVNAVGEDAFYGCKKLENITVPEHLTIGLWCGDYGTQRWGHIVAAHHRQATDTALKKYVLERVWSELSIEVQAEIFMAHQSKGMLEAFRKCVEDVVALGEQILLQLPEDLSAKDATKVANYIQLFGSKGNTAIRPLYQRLQGQKKAAKALAKLQEDAFLISLLEEDERTLSPLEQALNEALAAKGVQISQLPALIKSYHGLTESGLPALLDAEGQKVPAPVLMYLLIAHETQADYGWGNCIEVIPEYEQAGVCPEAAAVVALLDGASLQQALVTIGNWYLGSTGRNRKMFLAYPICRYGDEETMKYFTAKAPSWRSRMSGIDAPPLFTFRQANRYSNTRAAMMFADRYKELIEYARLRGANADALRDCYLSDVGLDAQGRKEYDLGNQIVTVVLQKDLSLVVCLPDGKTAKSLPKKGADEAKYTAANTHFADMRKSVKRIVKNRKDLLFEEFLTGKKRRAASWQDAYLHNPVLRSVAELLVWVQGKATFTVTADGPITADGAAYTLTDAPVAVAHPMEMTTESVTAWQGYFLRHGLKQPFEQVWEPVADWSTLRPNRYAGCRIPYYRFVGQEKRGITVADYNFHEEIDITLPDCQAEIERLDWERHHIDMNHCFEITLFKPFERSRLTNHIIAYLDRCTIYERIRNNDVSIVSLLHGFTVAQIAEFIRVAVEHRCTEVTALLLDYQQTHFADVDPTAEFTLE